VHGISFRAFRPVSGAEAPHRTHLITEVRPRTWRSSTRRCPKSSHPSWEEGASDTSSALLTSSVSFGSSLTSSSSRSSALPGPPPGVSGSPTGNFRPHPAGHPPLTIFCSPFNQRDRPDVAVRPARQGGPEPSRGGCWG
jgi:hypothetical protein